MNQNQYDETLNYIHSLGMYSKKKAVDLSKMQYLCSLFDNPQECFDVIHIAGTNGKGSTVAMLCNILAGLGYNNTGKYISPFIERFNERISVNGVDIPDDELVFLTNLIRDKIASANIPEDFLPNEFEFITIVAFLYYKKCGCEIVILETGLGGTLDPTNVVKNPLASVITSISFDHMAVLGDTLEKIAGWKCGIIKDNSLTVLYPLNESAVINLVEATAKSKNNNLIFPDISQIEIIKESLEYTEFRYKRRDYKIKLIGNHQVYNAVTVIETILTLVDCGKVNPVGTNSVRPPTQNNLQRQTQFALTTKTIYEAIYQGLAETYFPARFEVLSASPLVIFDGAHNISGVETLSKNINKLLGDKKVTLICGMSNDKQPEISLEKILKLPQLVKFIAVAANSNRAIPSKELCEIAKKYYKNAEYIEDFDTLKATLNNLMQKAAEDEAIICFGSLYLAGGIKQIVRDYTCRTCKT